MSEAPLVLVSSPLFERDRIVRGLEAAGYRAALLPDTVDQAGSALLAEAAAAIVSPECRLTEEAVMAAPRLQIVASPVIGVDHIAVDALTDRGIPVAHGADPVNFVGMAEAVVGLIVSLLHRFKAKEDGLRTGEGRVEWPGRLVSGRTIGLVGAGRIGRAVIDRLAGWGCEIVVADPHVDSEHAKQWGARVAELPEVLEVADVLSVQVPLTASTRGLIGEAELSRLPDGAYVVNIGRGGVIDETALAKALRDGRLAGAAVDVWEEEPPPRDHPLLGVGDQVIATPHNVGHTIDAYRGLADLAVEHVSQGLAGKRPTYLVNPAVFES